MMQGFFEEAELLTRPPTPRLPSCGKCGLLNGCRSPKMPVAGKGARKILIIGEAPGEQEDRSGKPFVGPAGERLQRELRAADIDIFEDCWVTNALRCRPPGNEIKNERCVDYCRPLAIRSIEELKPRVILLLGKHAVRSVITELWKEDPGGIGTWTGFRIPSQRWNAWVCPVHHPSYVMRLEDENKGKVESAEFAKQVRTAVSLRKRPWAEIPNYKDRCVPVTDPTQAAALLTSLQMSRPGRIAFDFETSTLKPDGDHAGIVCCSVSDGTMSMAFPWVGDAISPMSDILSDPRIAKVGWNVKFEDRWCRRQGIRVRGWGWDGMLAAHAIDGRPKISGLKFQAFVRLGADEYSSSLEPYMKAKGGNDRNRLREVGMRDLLRYCALDSMYEYAICEQQMKELGHGDGG